jgi:hypothetical protein
MPKKSTSSPHLPVPSLTVSSDQLNGFWLIAIRLKEIPEFREWWLPAFAEMESFAASQKQRIDDLTANLSAEGRGAAAAATSPAFRNLERGAQLEALVYFYQLGQGLDDIASLQWDRYRRRIHELVRPLRLQGIAEVMFAIDFLALGLMGDVKPKSAVDDPRQRQLADLISRGLSGLAHDELSQLSPARRRKMIKPQIGRVSRHMKTFNLIDRIDFWIANKVHGLPIREIANMAQDDGALAPGVDRYATIRRYIRQTNQILGYEAVGRPRPGGAVAQWKLLTKW